MSVDPSLFSDAAIDDETRAHIDQIRAFLADAPPEGSIPVEEIRAARRAGLGVFGRFEESDRAVDRTIAGADGPLTIREIRPDGDIRGVYLHMHGGGWVVGEPYEMDQRHVALADRHAVATVSVDYRLAPEHRYPAANDDCETAATWLVENAASEFGTDRLAIGGESAGGHLAAVTLLRMRDRHGYTGFRGANLVYGAYDMSLTPSVANWGTENLILSTPIIKWFYKAYVDKDRRRHPDVSPLYAHLHDLPPALFTIGTLDPLIDDTLFMSQRWAAAGNRTELEVYPGGVHAFDYYDTTMGRRAVDRILEFIGAALEPAGDVPA